MLNIVCVNAANYQGRGAEYTNKLFNGAVRNLPEWQHSQGFNFTCFTDDHYTKFNLYNDRISVRPLPNKHLKLKGWYNKLSLFQPSLFDISDRILYLDLSCVIVGDLSQLIEYSGDFCMVHPFIPDNSSAFGGKQSQVMSWPSGFGEHIWDYYRSTDYANHPGADQAVIENAHYVCDTWDKVAPDKVKSWKYDLNGKPDNNCAIVCMHGSPKPHQVRCNWIADIWNA